jgi:hypothetical protein
MRRADSAEARQVSVDAAPGVRRGVAERSRQNEEAVPW